MDNDSLHSDITSTRDPYLSASSDRDPPSHLTNYASINSNSESILAANLSNTFRQDSTMSQSAVAFDNNSETIWTHDRLRRCIDYSENIRPTNRHGRGDYSRASKALNRVRVCYILCMHMRMLYFMYVCTYVIFYVCMYVCYILCMYVRMLYFMYVCTYVIFCNFSNLSTS